MKDISKLGVWEDLPQGLYFITKCGDVLTRDRTVRCNKGYRLIKGKTLKLKLGTDGYYQVQLQHNRKSKYIRVHRLVAMAFLSPIKDKEYVNHKDGNKINNSLNNLEWCSNKENIEHAYKTGLMKNSKRTQFKKGHVPWNKGK